MSRRNQEAKLSDTFQISAPSSGMPPAVAGGVKQLSEEDLDAMINDPSGHPEIKANAIKMKKELFGGGEEPEVEEEIIEEVVETPVVEEKAKPKRANAKKKKRERKPQRLKDVNKKPVKEEHSLAAMKIKEADSDAFASVLNTIAGELYTEKIALLSNPESVVSIKSMTVNEYKFLSKHLEMFLDEYFDQEAEERKQSENKLSEALDTVLSRCVLDPVSIFELTIYDWIYLLLYIRGISRGRLCAFNLAKKGEEEAEKVEVDLYDMLDYIEENKDRFISNPLHTESIEDIDFVMMMPTRGDVKFAEQYCREHQDSDLSSINLAMSIKGFIREGELNLLNPEQRVEIFSQMNYDIMRSLSEAYVEADSKFVEVLNEYFEQNFPEYEALRVSDFILSFYDI